MKSVLNPDTNEVLGFDDNMSDDQIHAAIQSDKDGRPMVDVNPTPYEVMVRPALEQAKITGNPEVLYDARRRSNAQDPFNKALNHGISFGLTPENDPEVKKAQGVLDTIGNLAGQTASILATAGVGEVLGLGKIAAGAGQAAKGILPAAAQAAKVGSGTILPVTAGEVVANTAAGVTSSAALGAMYNGITESARQGKVFAEDHQAPDVAKIGESILRGAVSWAPYGVGSTFIPKTAIGLSSGVAATAGTAYMVSKAEGQSEPDARLNAILMGMFHFVSHASTLRTVNMMPEDRQKIVEDLQNTIADYTKAKNGLTESGNVHQMVGDEFVKSEAQQAIDEQNANLLSAAEEAKAIKPEIDAATAEENQAAKVASEEKLAGTFIDPYAPKMLEYLSQFIPAKYVVRMDGLERLRLANSPRKELVAYKAIHDEAAAEEAAGDARAAAKLENDIIARRTQNNTMQEITSSDTLTKALVENVTKKVISSSDVSASSQEQSKTGKLPAETTQSVEGGKVPTANVDTTKISSKAPLEPELKPVISSIESSLKETIAKSNAESNFKPETQPLEGTGEVKESGLSKSVEISAIQKGLTNDLGDLPSYQARDMADIAKKVDAFIAKDHELAKKIALGEVPEQDGLRSQELFTGLKIKAENDGDVNMLRDLALSDKATAIATELGQRVKALDSGGNEESPVEAIKQVKKSREEAVIKKSKSKSIEVEKNKVVKEIKEQIKKVVPTKETWASFVEALQC